MGSRGNTSSSSTITTPQDVFNNIINSKSNELNKLSIDTTSRIAGVEALSKAVEGELVDVTLNTKSETAVLKDGLYLTPSFKKNRKTGLRDLKNIMAFDKEGKVIKMYNIGK